MKPGDLTDYLEQSHPAQRYFSTFFQRNDALVIFDIGACEGEDAIRFSHAYPNAKIHCFEPLPDNIGLIRANFDKYSITQATVNAFALSNTSTEAIFHVSSGEPNEAFSGKNWNYGNKSSSLLEPDNKTDMCGWIEFQREITVQCKTLDCYCSQNEMHYIDLIHMDVQGAEGMVIEGGRETLGNVKAIWLELMHQRLYKKQKVAQEIDHQLQALGFRCLYTESRGIEEDRLYVNLNQPSTWYGYLNSEMRNIVSDARIQLGHIKSIVLGDRH